MRSIGKICISIDPISEQTDLETPVSIHLSRSVTVFISTRGDHCHYLLCNERQYLAIPYMSVSIQINIFKSSVLTLLFRMFITGKRCHVLSYTRVVTISTSRFHTRHNTTHITRNKIVNTFLFEWHVYDHYRNVDVIMSISVSSTRVAYRIRARRKIGPRRARDVNIVIESMFVQIT